MRVVGDLSGNADQEYVHPDDVAHRETRSLKFRRDLAELAACLRCRIADSLGRPGWCRRIGSVGEHPADKRDVRAGGYADAGCNREIGPLASDDTVGTTRCAGECQNQGDGEMQTQHHRVLPEVSLRPSEAVAGGMFAAQAA